MFLGRPTMASHRLWNLPRPSSTARQLWQEYTASIGGRHGKCGTVEGTASVPRRLRVSLQGRLPWVTVHLQGHGPRQQSSTAHVLLISPSIARQTTINKSYFHSDTSVDIFTLLIQPTANLLMALPFISLNHIISQPNTVTFDLTSQLGGGGQRSQ